MNRSPSTGSTGETDVPEASEIDPEAAQRSLRSMAEEIKAEELEELYRRLEHAGEVTPRQRERVRQMASRIVSELLHPVDRALSDLDESDREVAADVLRFFDQEP